MGLEWSYIFQQNNDPKYTALIVRDWLQNNVRNQLKRSPQSLDLNPIEHIWKHLDRRVRKHEVTIKETLKSVLREEWDKIDKMLLKTW